MKIITKHRGVFLTLSLLVLLIPFLAAADAPPLLLNPIACDDFLCLLLQIVRFLLAGVAVIATTAFIWGGFVFLTSAGNPEAVKKGKDILLWTTVGILIDLGSWVAISYVIKVLTNTTK